MNLNPYWYVGPWEWRTENGESFWAPPQGCIGSLDLRSIPAQSVAGGAPQGMGLFLTNGVLLGSNYTLLGTGHHRDLKTDQRIRDAFPKRVRRRQPQGDDLLGIIYDALGDGSDPTGDDGPKPLMPTTRGNISICIGGIRHSQWMKRGQRHWGKCLDVIRRDFAKTFDDAQKGRLKDREHHRRVLDALCDKYHADEWEEFVPQAIRKHVPGRLKHETTYTDDFNRASLGSNWTNLDGTFVVASNGVSTGSNATLFPRISYYNGSLSTDDHYAQIYNATNAVSTSFLCGAVRIDSSGPKTAYCGRLRTQAGSQRVIDKVVDGTATTIATSTVNATAPQTARLIVNGSDLDLWRDGSSVLTGTDTAITGNLHGGICGHNVNGSTGDDFEVSDLAAAPGILLTQLESTTRGYMRGTWTRG